MKKILITGANGFIGSHLVEEALANNIEVYAGVRKTSRLESLPVNDITLVYPNLSDLHELMDFFDKQPKFDYIIHNAGITKSCDKSMFEKVNYQYSKNLIDALINTNKIPEKYIQISSLAAYGPGNPVTLNPVKNSDNPQPVSLYGESKLKSENYLKKQKQIPYLIFRPTGVYGPREQDFYIMFKSIDKGIETYIGTKEQYISLIYVKDLSRLIINALKSKVIHQSYFASDLKTYTSYEMNFKIKKALSSKTISFVIPSIIVKYLAWVNEKFSCKLFNKIPTLNTEKYKEISQKNWLCDSQNLITDFKFKPAYTLEEGIRETLEWYKQNKLL